MLKASFQILRRGLKSHNLVKPACPSFNYLHPSNFPSPVVNHQQNKPFQVFSSHQSAYPFAQTSPTLKAINQIKYPMIPSSYHYQRNLPSLSSHQLYYQPSKIFCSKEDPGIDIPRPEAGLSDFAQRARLQLPIIDKTDYLYRLLDRRNSAFVMGPRRFGKTLDLTTVAAIFEFGKVWWEKTFPDFAIVRDHHYDFPEHPVLSFDFSGTLDTKTLKCKIATPLIEKIKASGLKKELEIHISKYHEDPSNASFFYLFENGIRSISRKKKKGVVILIDEYDRPITELAEFLLANKKITKLTDQPEMIEMVTFLKQLFETLKSLRVQHYNHVNFVRFEYLTGVMPISHLGLFSGPNDVFNSRMSEEFHGMLGYTEEEILEKFGDHINLMALKEFARREDIKFEEIQEEQKEKVIKIRDQILKDIKMNYDGFVFSYDQKETLYSPFAINKLFDSWKTKNALEYPHFYADSGGTKLIWRAVQMMSKKLRQKFFWALLDETKLHVLFTCPAQLLTMNQTLDRLYLKPEFLCFFSGVLAVKKEGSNKDLWKLGIVNNEMRQALLTEIENSIESEDSGINTVRHLFNENYLDYLNLINEKLKLMSVFTEDSGKMGCKAEHEVEHYGHTLLAVVHSPLSHFVNDEEIKEEFQVKRFKCIKDKATLRSSRPDFITHFDIKRGKDKKKVSLIMEFKCKETLNQSLKEAKRDLLEDAKNMKSGIKKKYSFLKNSKKIWVAVALGSGQIQGAILYELKIVNGEENFVEFQRWPQDLKFNDDDV